MMRHHLLSLLAAGLILAACGPSTTTRPPAEVQRSSTPAPTASATATREPVTPAPTTPAVSTPAVTSTPLATSTRAAPAATREETPTVAPTAAPTPVGTPAPPRVIDIGIRDYAFPPVIAGAPVIVRWTNFDPVDHDVTWSDGASPVFKLGETFERRFDAPGRYTYRCSIHAGMPGVVTVQ